MTNSTVDILPRNQDLPLFEPHVPNYTCAPAQLPPLDAQADAWFQEARALDSPEIYVGDRNYPQIVALTKKAADRRHWKAMLNLASFYLEGRDPPRGAEDAVKLVEDAMRLGVPAAYDRMGTYYMNGTGVVASATRAYAFWQLAAKMGSPDALAYLGEKLDAKYDHPHGLWWANAAVGVKMLECAYGQGSGNAAYELASVYTAPADHNATREDLARALVVWHNGVKFGCQKCASALSIEFDNPIDPTRMVAPHIDKARAARYVVLSEALDFDPDRRFPNLDKVLPLPPADLPPWNGDRATLINAAKGVAPPPPKSKPTAYSERKERFFLDASFLLAATGESTVQTSAPFEGYWQPRTEDKTEPIRTKVAAIQPALHATGERFDYIHVQRDGGGFVTVAGLTWELWRTVRHDDADAVAPQGARGRTREVAQPEPSHACDTDTRCPISGTWQPWIAAAHPMSPVINQYWRQTWVVAGQRFPEPRKDWMLDVAAADITWHLMDSVGVALRSA